MRRVLLLVPLLVLLLMPTALALGVAAGLFCLILL